MIAFQSIFALVPGVTGVVQGAKQVSQTWQIFAQIISNAAAAAPNIGRFLAPPGTSQSQETQWADLGNQFGGVIDAVRGKLNQTFDAAVSNVTEFLAFASQG